MHEQYRMDNIKIKSLEKRFSRSKFYKYKYKCGLERSVLRVIVNAGSCEMTLQYVR